MRRGRKEEVTSGTAVAVAQRPFGCDHWKKLKLKLPSLFEIIAEVSDSDINTTTPHPPLVWR